MTTDQELLAKIDADTEKLNDYIRHLKELIQADSHKSEPDWALVQYLDIAETSLKHLKALRVVVEMEEKTHNARTLNETEEGYNQALADVRQAIEKELG